MIPKRSVAWAILCSFAFLSQAIAQGTRSAAPSAGNELPTVPLRGTVVDEAGLPVPHVTVVTSAIGRPAR